MNRTPKTQLGLAIAELEEQPEIVTAARNTLLQRRAVVEILASRGRAADSRLCNYRYQASLRTSVEGAAENATKEALLLGEIAPALAEQVELLERTILEFDDLGVAMTAKPELLILIGEEMDDHQARIKELSKLLATWREHLQR